MLSKCSTCSRRKKWSEGSETEFFYLFDICVVSYLLKYAPGGIFQVQQLLSHRIILLIVVQLLNMKTILIREKLRFCSIFFGWEQNKFSEKFVFRFRHLLQPTHSQSQGTQRTNVSILIYRFISTVLVSTF